MITAFLCYALFDCIDFIILLSFAIIHYYNLLYNSSLSSIKLYTYLYTDCVSIRIQ